ncbi:hypothetical protein JQ599_26295 [Bradyrhizobium diazoefficiens]|nr:hypothetical protein [Bradyrhizobium diazoefficiens]MBR0703441.1 hypothetical protein [Bradyrhizobium diazoefficiens]MBR0772197.1 hypothetical protein [Bradyrhizobium diazoefficiens]
MNERVHCNHCEEEFAPEELTILGPSAEEGKLICIRCIEIELFRVVAKLPLEYQ